MRTLRELSISWKNMRYALRLLILWKYMSAEFRQKWGSRSFQVSLSFLWEKINHLMNGDMVGT
jgi:hypothetical protein